MDELQTHGADRIPAVVSDNGKGRDVGDEKLGALRAENARLSSDLETSQSKLASTERDLMTAESITLQLKKELFRFSQVSEVIAGLENENRVLSQKAQDADAMSQQVQKLTKLLDDSEKKNAAVAEKCVELQQTLSLVHAESNDMAKKLEGGSTEHRRLQEELKETNGKIAALQKDNDAMKVELDSLQAGRSAEASTASATLLKCTEERDEARKNLASALEKVTNAEAIKNKEVAAVREAAAKDKTVLVGEWQGRLKSANALNQKMGTVLLDMRKKVRDLQKEKKKVASSVQQLHGEMAGLQSGLARPLMKVILGREKLLDDAIVKYQKESALRRKYFNKVQELKGNIRVYCRVRPMAAAEKGECVAKFVGNDSLVLPADKGLVGSFEFDRVFTPESSQEDVFVDTEPLVTSVLDGYNVCVFAYGQTGSGKTHTMMGYPGNPGVNLRALQELFRLIEERQQEFKYEVRLSVLEIYNETIRDLLAPPEVEKTRKHDIHPAKGTTLMFVDNLTETTCTNIEDVMSCMKTGDGNRSVGVTKMNEHSSRSHAIVMIKVHGTNILTGTATQSKLTLIDLAGSERVGKSEAVGARLKEAQAINKSLSALGNVISSLTAKNAHVPYRDSKLTFLLQDSLGGNSKTLMFVNASPAPSNLSETVCSLNFASRARSVELGVAKRQTENPEVSKWKKIATDLGYKGETN